MSDESGSASTNRTLAAALGMQLGLTHSRALAVSQDPILRFAVEYLRANGFTLPAEGSPGRAWCEKRAEQGDADAQVVVGELSALGLYGEQNIEAARRWIERAADRNHLVAMLILASFVEAGSKHEASDTTRALSLVEAAAELACAPALTQLGVTYLHGVNVPPNREHALALLRKSALLGDRQAQYMLGAELAKESQRTLVEEGVRWIETAATQGFAGAHRHLGYLYKDGSNGLPQNEETSRRHFFLAAQIEENASADIA